VKQGLMTLFTYSDEGGKIPRNNNVSWHGSCANLS